MAESKITLTQVAAMSRQGILFFVVLIIFGTIIRISIPSIKSALLTWNPPPPPPPSPIYGVLPRLEIPKINVPGTPTYSLETSTGRLPNFPEKAYVFEISRPSYTYLSGARARATATALGFSGEPIKKGADQIWNNEEKQATLSANIITGHLSISTNLASVGARLLPGSAPSPQEAKTFADGFLDSITPTPPQEYITSRKETQLELINGGILQRADFPDQAQMIRVDIFRSVTIGDTSYPVLGPNPKEGMIVLRIGSEGEIITADYRPWTIQIRANPGSYTTRPISVAWDEVKNGKAAVVYLREEQTDPYQNKEIAPLERIDIHSVYLAYLDSYKYQRYVQPIYVFEGIGITQEHSRRVGFVAYVGAIAEEWYENK